MCLRNFAPIPPATLHTAMGNNIPLMAVSVGIAGGTASSTRMESMKTFFIYSVTQMAHLRL